MDSLNVTIKWEEKSEIFFHSLNQSGISDLHLSKVLIVRAMSGNTNLNILLFL